LKEPRVLFSFRDKFVPTVVPVYTKLTDLEAVSRSGDQVVMDGASRVYNRPDDTDAFFRYIKVRAGYTGNAATNGNKAWREDVVADIGAGLLRSYVLDAPTVYYIPPNEGNPWGTNARGEVRSEASILTLDGCTAYREKQKLIKAGVTFDFCGPYDNLLAGRDSISQRSTSIQIGMMNYTAP